MSSSNGSGNSVGSVCSETIYQEFQPFLELAYEQEQQEDVEEEEDIFGTLTDAQVLELMADMETEARHWKLENEVFWWFLEDNDPNLLQGVPEMLEKAILLKFGDSMEIQNQTRSRSSKLSFGSVASIIEGRAININLVQKSDMVLKATELKQSALNKFVKKSHITRRNTLCELEEFRLREVDITMAQKIFEFHVVLEGFDSLTQRIPAEKFLKYMQDWFRAAGSDIEKLRLRTAHMKLLYRKACALQESRQELAKTLHAVDFDRLIIENGRLHKQFETKMIFLLETKQRAGATSRALNSHKHYLMKLQEEQEDLRKRLVKIHQSIKSIEQECVLVEEEVLRAKKEYSEFMYIAENYRVPDVMVYVNMKKEYADIQHETKVWQRKKNVLDISLRAAIKEMMNLTGAKEVDSNWFEEFRVPPFIDEATFSKLVGSQKSMTKSSRHEPKSSMKITSKSSKRRHTQSSLDPSKPAGSGSKAGMLSEELMYVISL